MSAGTALRSLWPFRLYPVLALWQLLVAGCAIVPGALPGAVVGGEAVVSRAAACAIGYDLAREIDARVSLRQTVLVASRNPGPCERWALEYLRRAGFMIDRTRGEGAAFEVAIVRIDADHVSAVASLGELLRIARVYRPVRSGAYPAGAVSVVHLDPLIFERREGS